MELPMRVCEEGIVHRRGEFVGDFGTDENGSFVCPAATDVLDGVPASADDEEGYVVFADKVDAFSVSCDGEVECPQSIAP